MANLVIGAGLMAAGVGALVAIRRHNKAMAEAEEMHEKQAFYTARDFPRYPMAAGAAIIAAGAVVLALGCFYPQDAGEVIVLRNLGEIGKDGNLVVVPEGSQPIVGTSD